MKDKIKNKKVILLLVIAVIGISAIVLSNNSNTSETIGTGEVIGELKITDITSKVEAGGASSSPVYYYGIKGIIENLSITGDSVINDKSYVIETKFYDPDGNLIERGTPRIIKESATKSKFDTISSYSSFTSENKRSVGKVEINLLDKKGNVLISTTYQFNNNEFEDKTVDRSSSSSSSDSSDSSSSGETFEDGFRDGQADAKAGNPAKYSGDPISYSDPYQAGYADGYQNPYLV